MRLLSDGKTCEQGNESFEVKPVVVSVACRFLSGARMCCISVWYKPPIPCLHHFERQHKHNPGYHMRETSIY